MIPRQLHRLATMVLVAGIFGLLTVPTAMAGYKPDTTAPRADIPEGYQWNANHISLLTLNSKRTDLPLRRYPQPDSLPRAPG